MVDKLLDTLAGSGPLGILCAVLLMGYLPCALALRTLYLKHCESEAKWMEIALDTQEAVLNLTRVIELLKEHIRVGRR